MTRQPQVVVVGAGMSGLGQAILLARAGFTDVTVVEKAATLGGTWRDNRYPGLTCDVPSHLYQYSFDVNPTWTRMFSPGEEIRAYFEDVAHRHDVVRSIRFGTEIVDAAHTGARWRLTTDGGDVLEAEFLILATGFLREPKTPAFDGLGEFTGHVCHSARWDPDFDPAGKRVAVIGNGSTGVQAVAAMAGVADHVTLFQRTPQWVVRLPNPAIPPSARSLMARIPLLGILARRVEHEIFGIFSVATTKDGIRRRLINRLCERNLESVGDPVLRAKLAPSYRPMCKRLIVHPNFYQKVQRPDVSVETVGIDGFERSGIRTEDGRLHEVDAVMMATGFHAHAYVRPATVGTHDGTRLDDVWSHGPRGFKSVAVEGMPNLFMLLGPHSPIGNFSLVQIAEAQSSYVIGWIRRWAAGEFETMMPTPAAVEGYVEHIRRGMPGTVWTTGCASWYLGEDGLPELWTYRPGDYLRLLGAPDDGDYALRRDESKGAPSVTSHAASITHQPSTSG
jgi:cation diffusion facilitator CzcD-associated flavoprotein CzcO